MAISLRAMEYIHSTGTPSFFERRPWTRREALAHLASWREPNLPPYQGAVVVPQFIANTGRWALGFVTEARLTDAACVDLIWGGTEHSRPGAGLAWDLRYLHLDAHHPAALSRLMSCAQLYDTARAAVVEAVGPEGYFAPPRVPLLGGMRAAMARLIVGVDHRGHFVDEEPALPGAFPRELALFRVAPAPPPAAGAAPPAGDPAPLRSGPPRRSSRHGP